MALKKNKDGTFNKTFKPMRDLNKNLEESFANVEAGTESISQALKRLPKEYQGVVKLQMDLNKQVEEQGKKYDGVYGSFLKGTGFLRDQSKVLEDLQKQIATTNDPEKLKEFEEAYKGIKKEIKESEEIIGDFEAIFPGIADGMKKMNQMQALFNKLTEMNIYVKIAAAVLAVGAALIGVIKQANALSQEFGGGLKANMRIGVALKANTVRAKLFGLSAEQVRSSFDAIANTFGEVSVASARFAVDMARVSRNTGVSAENVANLVSLFNPLTNNSRELSLNMVEVVSNLAQAQGVASGVLIDELAGNADLFASFIGKGEKNLIKAAAAAKKVGIEFGGIVELGDGLLDITERINKEQTLSTILGKQISLERFTALNAAGDTVAAQEELARLLRNTADLSPQLRRLFASELGLGVADIQRLTGLRSGGMPTAGAGGGSDIPTINKKGFDRMTKAIEKNTRILENNL